MNEMAGEEIVLFTRDAIARRVEDLAEEIASAQPRFDIAVPILTGAFVFAADLLRALAERGLVLPVEFIWLRAYGKAEQPGKVKILARPSEVVQSKNVLVIDGVLDRGVSLTVARELLLGAGAASVASVVAVAKKIHYVWLKPIISALKQGQSFFMAMEWTVQVMIAV